MNTLEIISSIASILSLVTIGIYTYLTYKLANSSAQQTETAKTQAKVLESQFRRQLIREFNNEAPNFSCKVMLNSHKERIGSIAIEINTTNHPIRDVRIKADQFQAFMFEFGSSIRIDKIDYLEAGYPFTVTIDCSIPQFKGEQSLYLDVEYETVSALRGKTRLKLKTAFQEFSEESFDVSAITAEQKCLDA